MKSMNSDNKGRRVVVTGMGAITPFGVGVDPLWEAVQKGQCGIRPLKNLPLQDLYITIGGEVHDFDPKIHCPSKALQLADRYSQYAAAAASEAIAASKLETPLVNGERAASIVGSGAGGLSTVEKAYEDLYIQKKRATHPLTLLRMIGSSAAAHISIEHGLKGPVFGTVSACSTASHAIGLSTQLIRAGAIDVAVAGASEAAITYGSMRSWQAMRVLSPNGCFPFSKKRNGTVLAEGAGILVLEERNHALNRDATILAEIKGFGMTSDAADMVNPSIEGPAVAMQLALNDGQLSSQDITYLNAHGTATTANDINETRAIKRVFGDHAKGLAISSTKSMHGHCLGAGGAIEAILCIQAIQNGFIPATIGFDEPGDECDLDYTPNVGRRLDIPYAMSNSFAFGGLNAVLVFGSPDL